MAVLLCIIFKSTLRYNNTLFVFSDTGPVQYEARACGSAHQFSVTEHSHPAEHLSTA